MPDELPTVQHDRIVHEHAALRRMLNHVSEALNDRYAPLSLLSQRLAELRDEISDHFIIEEQGGFFRQVTTDAPRLRPKADRLLQQHLQLYTEIANIAEQAGQLAGTQIERDELLSRFEQFCKDLSDHEHKENELLQETYTSDVGTKD